MKVNNDQKILFNICRPPWNVKKIKHNEVESDINLEIKGD